jgi:hypothetical protein
MTIPRNDVGKIYVGDRIRFWRDLVDSNGLITPTVIAEALELRMILTAPEGYERGGLAYQYDDPVAGPTTWIYYDTVYGDSPDLDRPGQWMVQGYFIDKDGHPHHGTATPVMVYIKGE